MVDRRCDLCQLSYPRKVLYLAKGTNMYLCGFCIDTILHYEDSPLRSPVAIMEAKQFLEYTRHWLNTPKGGLCVVRNTRRLEQLDTRNPEPGEVEMITCVVIGCYVNVLKARIVNEDTGRQAWSICALVDKDDKKGIADIEQAVEAAIDKGIEINKFPKTARPILKLPLRDGDEEIARGTRGPEFKNKLFFNANRYEEQGAPGVVDRQAQEIMDADEIYSGAEYRLDVNFYPFKKKGQQGVACGLNNVMKWADGDRLDGKQKATDAFEKYADLTADADTDRTPSAGDDDTAF